jgi:hypothetical protein
LDDALMTSANVHWSPVQPLRTAAVGGLAFTVLYLVHRLLQGTGPDGSSAATVAAYQFAHRGALLASEVAVGLALLAFIAFLAALVPVIWRAGQEPLAVAVGISGGVFVAIGFLSNAAETALIGVADTNQPAAVAALDQLQGRTPIVWTITALVAVLSLAIYRTGLVGLCQVGARGRPRRRSQRGAGRLQVGQAPAQQASRACSSPSSCHKLRPTLPVSGGVAAPR